MADKQTNHIKALTGLRFVAAMLVFHHHISGYLGVPKTFLPLGDVGVSFFFVLSGFILTYVYHQRLTWSNVGKFYFTRWARIWPLHAFVLLIWAWANFSWLGNSLDKFWPRLLANVFLVQSWIPNYGWIFSGNGVSWSIATEAFFYLMFPLLLLGSRIRLWHKTVLVVAVAIALVVFTWFKTGGNLSTGWVQYRSFVHTFPAFRLFEFVAGIWVGKYFLKHADELRAQRRSVWADTAVEIVVLQMLIWHQLLIPTLGNVLPSNPVFGTGLFRVVRPTFFYMLAVFVFAYSRGWIARFCGSRPMVYLGEISFAFYMIHVIILIQMRKMTWDYEQSGPWSLFAISLVFSICAAGLLYELVEVPAKAFLLKMYDRKPLQAFSEVLYLGRRFCFSFRSVALLAVLCVAWMGKNHCHLDYNPDPNVNQTISKTTLFQRPVLFGDEAVLHGLTVQEVPKGLYLQMVWATKDTLDKQRFLHACDTNSKIIGHLPSGQQRLQNATPGERWHETLLIPTEQLDGVASACIGFFSHEDGIAPMYHAPKGHFPRRLIFYRNKNATPPATVPVSTD